VAIGHTRTHAPAETADPSEVVTLKTSSGWSLAIEIREPRGRALGTAILLHSMMASRRIWNTPREHGVASVLRERGIRTLALDFRGHGDSGPLPPSGASWCYDDLVLEDIPALCRAARERWPNDKVTLVGHSLGGHASIASASRALADADAVAALATNVWLPSEEPNPILFAKKAAMVRICELATRARGYFPARALRFGSDDEAGPFTMGWTGWWRSDRWTSDDGRLDYQETMSKLAVPLLAMGSMGDRQFCTPAAAVRFAKRAPAGLTAFELVRRADDGGAAPDHMQFVTTRAAVSAWHRVAEFCAYTSP
jgi:predicted alpha/beta hydrolase